MERVSDPRRLDRFLRRAGLAEVAADFPSALYRCPAGAFIARQGEALDRLYVFMEGRAKVVRLMENGRTMLHAFYRGVSLLGDLELCRGDRTARTSVQAVTGAWLIGFDLAGRREAMLGDARLLRLMSAELAAKLDQASESAAQNLLYPLTDRLLQYMREARSGGVFSESLTSTAELLGVSYRAPSAHAVRAGEGGAHCARPRRLSAAGGRIERLVIFG